MWTMQSGKILQTAEAFISNPWVDLALGCLLVVIAYLMNQDWVHGLILFSWILMVVSVFRMQPDQELVRRFLWTMLFGAAVGLLLYYTLWTRKNPVPVAETSPALSNPISHEPEPPAEGPTEKPASVEFRAQILSPPPAHPLNTILGGITWQKNYTDLRLDITNGSIPIQNLNIKITLDNDQGIAALGQLSNFPSVTIFPTHDNLPGGRPSAPAGLRIMNDDGTFSPDDPFKEDSTVQYAYGIHCDNVFPESTLRFIVASVPYGSDERKTNPPQAPRTIHITGSYDTNGPKGLQTHPIEITENVSR